MFVLRTETHMTLVEIGKEFGRDHTTVLAACRKQASVAEVPEYKQAMESIRSMIQSTSRQIPFYADTNPCSGCGAVRRELLELRIEFEQFRAGFRFGDGERN